MKRPQGRRMQKSLKVLLVLICTVGSIAWAQNTGVMTTKIEEKSPWEPSMLMGLKSFNDSGRITDMNNPNGRTLKAKQEVYLGAKAANGWGGYAQMVQTANGNNNPSNDKWSVGDPSITLLHPTIYDGVSWRVWGQYRQYFPLSDRSKSLNQYQSAYYLYFTARLNETDNVFNQFTPRYFTQSTYAPTDTKLYFEDRTALSHKVSSWFRFGFGQWSQYETHAATAAGTSVEVFPYADFIVSKNIYFGPRLQMPVYMQNSVYDGPRAVATDNMLAEIYFEAAL